MNLTDSQRYALEHPLTANEDVTDVAGHMTTVVLDEKERLVAQVLLAIDT